MLIPTGCDAPIYHRPYGTIALMVFCVVLHVVVWKTGNIEHWVLNYGNWNPLEWISSALVHANWRHLLGNMLFFWVFGMVIEGKIGWWRFLLVLMGIAGLSGAIEQTIMLGTNDGGSLGLSSVIFGLIVIAWLWAPENEVDFLLFVSVYTKDFSLALKYVGMIYIMLEVFSAFWSGLHISTPVLHLLGVLAGLPIGIVFLRRGWVDCEGWDVFSLRKKRLAMVTTPVTASVKKPMVIVPSVEQVADVETLLMSQRLDAAFAVWRRQRNSIVTNVALMLAHELEQKERWQEAGVIWETLVERPDADVETWLGMATVLVRIGKPSQARVWIDRVKHPTMEQQRVITQLLHDIDAKVVDGGIYEFA